MVHTASFLFVSHLICLLCARRRHVAFQTKMPLKSLWSQQEWMNLISTVFFAQVRMGVRFLRHTAQMCTVWVKKIPPEGPEDLWQFFQNGWEFFFNTNFACLLRVPIYARLWIFVQLTATLTKLCHIKRDHPVHIMCAKCPPSAETHAGIFWKFSKTIRNFYSKFYTPIKRSYAR